MCVFVYRVFGQNRRVKIFQSTPLRLKPSCNQSLIFVAEEKHLPADKLSLSHCEMKFDFFTSLFVSLPTSYYSPIFRNVTPPQKSLFSSHLQQKIFSCVENNKNTHYTSATTTITTTTTTIFSSLTVPAVGNGWQRQQEYRGRDARADVPPQFVSCHLEDTRVHRENLEPLRD